MNSTAIAATAVFGLFMFCLDVLTSTTPFHNRKAHTMFTLSVSIAGTDVAEDYATRREAVYAGIVAGNELDVSLIGLYGAASEFGDVTGGHVFDTLGYSVGTWSIVDQDEADALAVLADAGIVDPTGDVVASILGDDLDDAPWSDVEPLELASILTDADLDGWADDDSDAYLAMAYADLDDYADDYEPEYVRSSGTWR